MGRRIARKHVFILIYQSEFYDSKYFGEIFDDYLTELEDIVESDEKFIRDELDGVIANKAYLDGVIGKYSDTWSVERLSKVDLSILRLCIYEMLKAGDIPESVSINEAVELAKLYGGDNSPSFINGILSSVSKDREKLI